MNVASRLSSRGPYTAMASAVLFGAGAPLAKLLLGEGINPGLLAGQSPARHFAPQVLLERPGASPADRAIAELRAVVGEDVNTSTCLEVLNSIPYGARWR